VPANVAGRPRSTRMDAPIVEAPAAAAAGVPSELSLLLASPLPRSGLPIRVQAVSFRGRDRKPAVRLVIEVLGRSLTFAERSGRFEEQLDLALLTVDDRARAGNGRTAKIDVKLTPIELQRVKATGVRWLAQLDLEPGHYQLRVAARALRSGTSGTVALDVDVPAFEPERLAMSGVTMTSLPSVLMVTRGDPWLQAILETPPSAARSFVAGDRIKAAVEVYVPAAAPAESEITAQVERPDGSRMASALRKIARGNGKPRAEAIAFPVDTASLPAGRYVLHLALDSSSRGAAVERRIPFDVVRRD
jgi:hypothetical protein